ncbi:hypothetical protein [Paraburkholderia atlantica]|uniref:hypothetical protein n=1 Tax=Paraburkholderia atlantica TaxID=2654982 RepID=UPI003D1D0FA4
MARGDFIDAVRAIALSRSDELGNVKLQARNTISTRSDASAFFRSAESLTDTGSFVDADGNPVTIDDPAVIGLVSKQSVIGLVAAAVAGGWRSVQPFGSIARQTLGTSASWVGEAGVKIVGNPPLFVIDRALVRKVVGTVIVADELLRRANAAVKAALQADLIRAVVTELNAELVSNSAPSASSPGGLLFGVLPLPSSGDIAADVSTIIGAFRGDFARACWIMSPRMAVGLVRAFHAEQTLGISGGYLCGLAAVAATGVSDNVLALVDCSRVLMLDGPLTPSAASHASLAVNDESGETPVTSIMSLWAQNLVALRCEKYAWWSAGEDAAVWVDDVEPLTATPAPPASKTPAVLKSTKGAQ